MAMSREQRRQIEAEAAAKGMTPLEYLDWKVEQAEAEVVRLEGEAVRLEQKDADVRTKAHGEMSEFIDTVQDPAVAEDLRKATRDWLDPDGKLGLS